MLHAGLVSITFRGLTPPRIIDLVALAGLEGIEWGGDVHVPHGDLAVAREVRRQTADAGLAVPSYGSYYRLWPDEDVAFGAVLDTAVALGAPVVRVWAGRLGSDQADADHRARIVEQSRRIADQAASAGVTVAYEFHGNTLTDTNASALALLDEVAHQNVRSYWQPAAGMTHDQRLAGLTSLGDRLAHVHVYSWCPDTRKRLPLADGYTLWQDYLRAADAAAGLQPRYAMLEFVRDDDPDAFGADAATLKQWLAGL